MVPSMRASLVSYVDPLVIAAAAALVLSLLLQNSCGGDVEILSEILCWLMLTVGVEAYSKWFHREKSKEFGHTAGGNHSTTIAISITLSSLCRSLDDIRWITPLVTPILLVVRQYIAMDVGGQLGAPYPRSNANSIWAQGAVALGSILALIPVVTMDRVVAGCMFVLAQVSLYGHLIAITHQGGHPLTTCVAPEVLRKIAYKTVAMTLIGTWVRFYSIPAPKIVVIDVLLAGITKAAGWLLLLQMTQRTPWDIAATTSTFAIASSTTSFAFSSTLRALARSATVVAALVQTISFIPKTTRARSLLYTFGLCLFLPLLKTNKAVRSDQMLTEKYGSLKQRQHPIEHLIRKSSEGLSAMLERQSTTLEAAVAEYQRRYHRAPPHGFDKWFTYAKAQEALIIDDYDSISESLKPFWKVSAAELRENIERALNSSGRRLERFEIKDGKVEVGTEIWKMLKDVQQDLPDVTLVLNNLDEPRVFVPNELPDGASANTSSSVEFYDLAHKNTWSVVARACSGEGETSRQPADDPVFTFGLPFVQSAENAKNLCGNPQYENMHGIFTSPDTFLYTDAFVPIFSPAKLSTSGDVLFPPPFYVKAEGDYRESNDHPWGEKKSIVYWAGSTTGGYASQGNWRMHNRQRFVTVANQLNDTITTFLSEVRPGLWKNYDSLEVLTQLYEVKFGNIVQCDEDDCEAQREFFHVGEWQERSIGLRHRFLFDLDGNSFSGRFYTLLRSHSVVMKQTIFKEWHDERLFPWVHYVPISLELDELPETTRYLALTMQGSRRAKEIAENGRVWMSKALRREDATIYFYRLILEYARLLDDNRDNQGMYE